MQVNDLGNSGGLERDIQITLASLEMLPMAVNDRPRITAPMEMVTIEDWSFSFVNAHLLGLAGLAFPVPKFYSDLAQNWVGPSYIRVWPVQEAARLGWARYGPILSRRFNDISIMPLLCEQD